MKFFLVVLLLSLGLVYPSIEAQRDACILSCANWPLSSPQFEACVKSCPPEINQNVDAIINSIKHEDMSKTQNVVDALIKVDPGCFLNCLNYRQGSPGFIECEKACLAGTQVSKSSSKEEDMSKTQNVVDALIKADPGCFINCLNYRQGSPGFIECEKACLAGAQVSKINSIKHEDMSKTQNVVDALVKADPGCFLNCLNYRQGSPGFIECEKACLAGAQVSKINSIRQEDMTKTQNVVDALIKADPGCFLNCLNYRQGSPGFIECEKACLAGTQVPKLILNGPRKQLQ